MATSSFIVPELLKQSMENYETWSLYMERYMRGKKLWDIVENEMSGVDNIAQVKDNAKALHAILISSTPEVVSEIKTLQTAREAWLELKERHEDKYKQYRILLNTYHPTGGKFDDESIGKNQELYNAALQGDWTTAQKTLTADESKLYAKLDHFERNVHLVAAAGGNTQFLKQLFDKYGDQWVHTVLSQAAWMGKLDIAKLALEKNSLLLSLTQESLILAALSDQKNVVSYLYSQTHIQKLSQTFTCTLLESLIQADNFDIALKLTRDHPMFKEEFITSSANLLKDALKILAGRLHSFESSSNSCLGFWQRLLYSLCSTGFNVQADGSSLQQGFFQVNSSKVPNAKKLHDKKLMHQQAHELTQQLFCCFLKSKDFYQTWEILGSSLIEAAKFGILEFFTMAHKYRPLILFYRDYNLNSSYHVAIQNRQEKIFKFLTNLPFWNSEGFLKEGSVDNSLLLAGKIAPAHRLKSIPGAALQMQREVQWFKTVEQRMPPLHKGHKNSEGMTAYELFSREHRELVAEGEKWLKDTATSCTLVATLIITITFAALFTVPGGNKDDLGTPIFLREVAFIAFVVSDALALFSSTTSVLMFVAILTSRYTEEAFMSSLPKKLIIGLSMLFLSLAAMMTAFSSTVFIMLDGHFRWISILLTLFASVPVTLFTLSQLPLFIDIVHSTYFFSILD
ncbi:PREDICTED: uncharacterized protein LOC104612086 isoform X2 [Nelumbo nucifera]|uniref:Uncharacterized protein LOC104612086 isoform X2 n=1 Tax=Nelumbo nucifera TaxID=4432 RepID=A0A1U8QB15_NELNU|nr:PREDICTED: uncharacterized protein LOC104612086 isoform X2 [Nelumbo nucifera]